MATVIVETTLANRSDRYGAVVDLVRRHVVNRSIEEVVKELWLSIIPMLTDDDRVALMQSGVMDMVATAFSDARKPRNRGAVDLATRGFSGGPKRPQREFYDWTYEEVQRLMGEADQKSASWRGVAEWARYVLKVMDEERVRTIGALSKDQRKRVVSAWSKVHDVIDV